MNHRKMTDAPPSPFMPPPPELPSKLDPKEVSGLSQYVADPGDPATARGEPTSLASLYGAASKAGVSRIRRGNGGYSQTSSLHAPTSSEIIFAAETNEPSMSPVPGHSNHTDTTSSQVYLSFVKRTGSERAQPAHRTTTVNSEVGTKRRLLTPDADTSILWDDPLAQPTWPAGYQSEDEAALSLYRDPSGDPTVPPLPVAEVLRQVAGQPFVTSAPPQRFPADLSHATPATGPGALWTINSNLKAYQQATQAEDNQVTADSNPTFGNVDENVDSNKLGAEEPPRPHSASPHGGAHSSKVSLPPLAVRSQPPQVAHNPRAALALHATATPTPPALTDGQPHDRSTVSASGDWGHGGIAPVAWAADSVRGLCLALAEAEARSNGFEVPVQSVPTGWTPPQQQQRQDLLNSSSSSSRPTSSASAASATSAAAAASAKAGLPEPAVVSAEHLALVLKLASCSQGGVGTAAEPKVRAAIEHVSGGSDKYWRDDGASRRRALGLPTGDGSDDDDSWSDEDDIGRPQTSHLHPTAFELDAFVYRGRLIPKLAPPPVEASAGSGPRWGGVWRAAAGNQDKVKAHAATGLSAGAHGMAALVAGAATAAFGGSKNNAAALLAPHAALSHGSPSSGSSTSVSSSKSNSLGFGGLLDARKQSPPLHTMRGRMKSELLAARRAQAIEWLRRRANYAQVYAGRRRFGAHQRLVRWVLQTEARRFFDACIAQQREWEAGPQRHAKHFLRKRCVGAGDVRMRAQALLTAERLRTLRAHLDFTTLARHQVERRAMTQTTSMTTAAHTIEFRRMVNTPNRLAMYEWQLLPLRIKARKLAKRRGRVKGVLTELATEVAAAAQAQRDREFMRLVRFSVGVIVPMQAERRAAVERLGLRPSLATTTVGARMAKFTEGAGGLSAAEGGVEAARTESGPAEAVKNDAEGPEGMGARALRWSRGERQLVVQPALAALGAKLVRVRNERHRCVLWLFKRGAYAASHKWRDALRWLCAKQEQPRKLIARAAVPSQLTSTSTDSGNNMEVAASTAVDAAQGNEDDIAVTPSVDVVATTDNPVEESSFSDEADETTRVVDYFQYHPSVLGDVNEVADFPVKYRSLDGDGLGPRLRVHLLRQADDKQALIARVAKHRLALAACRRAHEGLQDIAAAAVAQWGSRGAAGKARTFLQTAVNRSKQLQRDQADARHMLGCQVNLVALMREVDRLKVIVARAHSYKIFNQCFLSFSFYSFMGEEIDQLGITFLILLFPSVSFLRFNIS